MTDPLMDGPLIDVNVNLSRWPTRRIRDDETPRLIARLKPRGVTEAWAGSFDGLLHQDIAAVNSRLADECRSHADLPLIPFGTINPTLPDWEEDLRRCAEDHQMPGIRLHPNYHGYTLQDELFRQVLQQATERRLIVGLVVQMEDERMMHPLLKVKPVNLEPLAEHVQAVPGLRLVVHNSGRLLRGANLAKVLKAGQVFVDIAFLEGLGVLESFLNEAPIERILFGSNAPYHYLESGLLKLQESQLATPQLLAIRHENARSLLGSVMPQ
jgi:predicted TIM-barrel fold metal-dependent hydrolase